jgi:predicted GNAT family N-acyltransferase
MIRRITAPETYELRQRVLRPQQAVGDMAFPGDDAPGAAHFGAFAGEVLVGVASITPQGRSGPAEPGLYRVRGMATAPEVRGGGYGGSLLEACLDHARGQGGNLVWCNARTTVADFYRRFGFQPEGDPFELPGIGPHVVMTRPLP